MNALLNVVADNLFVVIGVCIVTIVVVRLVFGSSRKKRTTTASKPSKLIVEVVGTVDDLRDGEMKEVG
jgi:hypothetical protein